MRRNIGRVGITHHRRDMLLIPCMGDMRCPVHPQLRGVVAIGRFAETVALNIIKEGVIYLRLGRNSTSLVRAEFAARKAWPKLRKRKYFRMGGSRMDYLTWELDKYFVGKSPISHRRIFSFVST